MARIQWKSGIRCPSHGLASGGCEADSTRVPGRITFRPLRDFTRRPNVWSRLCRTTEDDLAAISHHDSAPWAICANSRQS